MRALILLILLVSLVAHASENELIWATTMSQDEFGSSPYIDPATSFLLSEIHEFEIVPVLATPSRIMSSIKNNVFMCAGYSRKTTERLEFAIFSEKPHVIFPSYALIYKRSSELASYIQSKYGSQYVSIEKLLLSRPETTVGVVNNRYVSDKIQRMKASRHYERNFWFHMTSSPQNNLIELVLLDRLEAVIDFPTAISKHNRAAVFQYSILESATDKALGFLICPDTEQGKRFTLAFSIVLSRLSKTEKYFELYLGQFPPDFQEAASKNYNAFYGTNF